ncbi:hypothetical protein SLS58_005535 [Diplodia intermedia]|uniref:Clr5 domain-containing protein n=1 Tax=Diplodia intermedia TaxID=856260 RepID=A0ABR3TR18_9PEZI
MDAPASTTSVPPTQKREEKWETLKPTIEYWYMEKKLSVARLVVKMKENHGFHAVENEYKTHFKKWGLQKNIKSKDKTRIERVIMARAETGRTTVVKHKGYKVDPAKIRRHTKDAKRRDMLLRDSNVGTVGSATSESKVTLGKSIFLDWFMPFGGSDGSFTGHLTRPSPHDYDMKTPSDNGSPSTQRLVADVKRRASLERAQLFMQGHHDAVLNDLADSEARLMSTWLHQFRIGMIQRLPGLKIHQSRKLSTMR